MSIETNYRDDELSSIDSGATTRINTATKLSKSRSNAYEAATSPIPAQRVSAAGTVATKSIPPFKQLWLPAGYFDDPLSVILNAIN
jgi:hypothetical protein